LTKSTTPLFRPRLHSLSFTPWLHREAFVCQSLFGL